MLQVSYCQVLLMKALQAVFCFRFLLQAFLKAVLLIYAGTL